MCTYYNGIDIEPISPYTIATRQLRQVRMYVEVGRANASTMEMEMTDDSSDETQV